MTTIRLPSILSRASNARPRVGRIPGAKKCLRAQELIRSAPGQEFVTSLAVGQRQIGGVPAQNGKFRAGKIESSACTRGARARPAIPSCQNWASSHRGRPLSRPHCGCAPQGSIDGWPRCNTLVATREWPAQLPRRSDRLAYTNRNFLFCRDIPSFGAPSNGHAVSYSDPTKMWAVRGYVAQVSQGFVLDGK